MTTLVAGATGATGRLLVKQLLDRGMEVRVIGRSPDKLSAEIRDHSNLSLIHASILDLDDAALTRHVHGCDAIASCLGHNISLQGIYGHPHRLVTDATRRLCNAIKANNPGQPVKFVLMNSAGNRDRDLPETVSFAEQVVIRLIRLLVTSPCR